jgi:putative inorganic carbon (HCO3(-)) transporter
VAFAKRATICRSVTKPQGYYARQLRSDLSLRGRGESPSFFYARIFETEEKHKLVKGKKEKLEDRRTGLERVTFTVFLVLIFALPLAFAYPTNDIFELTKLTILRTGLLALLACWVLLALQKEKRLVLYRTPLDVALLIYLSALVVSTIFSTNRFASIYGVYPRFEGLLVIVNYALIFWLTVNLIRQDRLGIKQKVILKQVCLALIISADIVSMYGMLQRFGIDFFKWNFQLTDVSRAFSTVGNPIYVAAYLTLIGSLTIALLVTGASSINRVLLGVSASVMVSCIVITFSRAGWLGFGCSLLILTLTLGKNELVKQKKIIMVSLICLVLLVVSIVFLSVSKASPTTSSIARRAFTAFDLAKGQGVADRLSIWTSTIQMIKDRPLVGWGLETFGTGFDKYRDIDLLRIYGRYVVIDRPHSDILQTAVMTGMVGLIAYMILLFTFFKNAFGYLRSKSNSFEKALLCGFIAGIIGYLVQLQFSFSAIGIASFFWLFVGLTFAIGDKKMLRLTVLDWSSVKPKIENIIRVSGMVVTVVLFLGLMALTARPFVADYYFGHGRFLDGEGVYDEADTQYDKALNLMPDESYYLNYIADRDIKLARMTDDPATGMRYLESAIDKSSRAIEQDPDKGGYHYQLGNAYYYYAVLPKRDKKERREILLQAVAEYKRAELLNPLYPDSYLNLGTAYERLGDRQNALKQIEQALSMDPANTKAQAFLSKLKTR